MGILLIFLMNSESQIVANEDKQPPQIKLFLYPVNSTRRGVPPLLSTCSHRWTATATHQCCASVLQKQCQARTDESATDRCVMGNLGKPLNFPLVWTRKGAVEPRRSNWYCAARGYLRIGPSGGHCLGARHLEW